MSSDGGARAEPRRVNDSKVHAAQGVPGAPVTRLRGASVEVEIRSVVRVVAGLCVLALCATVVLLFVAGFEKNAQIARLRHQGVPVELKVTGCLGLMGGSGSNLAGYDCMGTFSLDGHLYSEAIPGSVLRSPGTRLRGIAVPGDPALVSTPRTMAREQASWRVFVLPTVLCLALGLILTAVATKRARMRLRMSHVSSLSAT